MTTINTMSARCLFNQQSNNNNNDGSDLPSPISPTVITTTALPILDLLLIHLQQRDSSSAATTSSSSPSQIPEGIPVSDEERARLSSELAQLKKLTTEAQQTYMTIHGTIQQYQQLVLSTHAQVAAAKRSLMQAREISNNMMNNNNNNNNTSNHNLYSNGSSRTSSPPSSPTSVAMPSSTSMSMSISSPRSRSDSFSFSFGTSISNSIIEEDKEEINEGIRLKLLEQEHESLGRKLTQLLRDKAAAEETKKRMNDGLLKAKARIKELEQKLGK